MKKGGRNGWDQPMQYRGIFRRLRGNCSGSIRSDYYREVGFRVLEY